LQREREQAGVEEGEERAWEGRVWEEREGL
jgi:hypothetical protein